MKTLPHLLLLMLVVAACRVTGPKFDARYETLVALTNLVSVSNRVSTEMLLPPKDPFRLGPGDRIEVEILGETGSRTSVGVGPDGMIYYDLADGIDVWGSTVGETKALLEKRLAPYYREPRVTVSLKDVKSRRVWVLGRLNNSGVYSLAEPMTVIEAVSRAGGLFVSRFTGTTEELADLEHSFLIRNGEMMPVNFMSLLRKGDMSQNIYLQPDDFLYLPSALSQEVYVLGMVRAPRPLGFTESMTLGTAIAKSLGPAPGAFLREVVIVRGALAEPRVALVNYQAIMLGQAPDVLLEPRDIVYVPEKPYKYPEKYAKMAVDTFVRTAAANEGGRAGSKQFEAIQPNSPIQIGP